MTPMPATRRRAAGAFDLEHGNAARGARSAATRRANNPPKNLTPAERAKRIAAARRALWQAVVGHDPPDERETEPRCRLT